MTNTLLSSNFVEPYNTLKREERYFFENHAFDVLESNPLKLIDDQTDTRSILLS
jgi:hypothetical protein